jgi:D-alanyl-D-alanine carboxypeptidase (penicillin-binding protein 5/6)
VIFATASAAAGKKRSSAGKQDTHTESANKSNKATDMKQAVLFDFETGEVIFSKDSDERCVPSSMTKMMTIYLVFEALADGRLHLSDELPVSEAAKSKEGSRSFFEAGTLAKVEDLVRSVIVHSGNDACVVLAEKLCGDEDAFAVAMNEKGAKFGLTNTNFVNATGLPHDDHYSSMHDLAIIAKHIIADFPQYYHYFSEKTFTVNGITQQNRNTLIGNSINVDGLKTGKTDAGGYGIVVSAKKNGKRLIAAVNGCTSSKNRAQEANKLLVSGFIDFMAVKIANKDLPVGTAAVSMGKRESINLYAKDDIIVSVPKKHIKSLVVELDVPEPLEAPITVGSKLGVLRYKYGNYVSNKYGLYAREPVESVNLFLRFMLKIKNALLGSEKKGKSQKIEEPGISKSAIEEAAGEKG